MSVIAVVLISRPQYRTHHRRDARCDIVLVGAHFNIRSQRWPVRVVDPCEVRDLPGARLSVETFRVAPLALFERTVDVDLDEALRTNGGADFVTNLAVGRDRGDEGDHPVAHYDLGVGGDSAHVFVAVGFREAEVAR